MIAGIVVGSLLAAVVIGVLVCLVQHYHATHSRIIPNHHHTLITTDPDTVTVDDSSTGTNWEQASSGRQSSRSNHSNRAHNLHRHPATDHQNSIEMNGGPSYRRGPGQEDQIDLVEIQSQSNNHKQCTSNDGKVERAQSVVSTRDIAVEETDRDTYRNCDTPNL